MLIKSKSRSLASQITKTYLVIILTNSCEKLTNGKIRLRWSQFEHCSKSLISSFEHKAISPKSATKFAFWMAKTIFSPVQSTIKRLIFLAPPICPNSYEKFTKIEIRSSWNWF